MRSRSKGNNNMQAMGCFETDHAQPRSKSPKARAVQHSEQQQPGCNLYIEYSASSIRWRSGWSRGLSRFTNDFRVKGGDGHGQLGSVGDHFWGKYILVRRADGATCAGRLLYEVQAPCGHTQKHPERTQNRPRTARQPHPGATWGRRGPRHSETSRPGDPADCNVFNWPAVILFFSSLFSRHVVYYAVQGRKRRRQSGHVTRR